MTDYGFDMARVTLLERHGRFSEAATIHLEEGRPMEAIRLFMRDTDPASRERATASVLQGFWEQISLGVSIPSQGSAARLQLDQLLLLAAELTSSGDDLEPRIHDEVLLYLPIVHYVLIRPWVSVVSVPGDFGRRHGKSGKSQQEVPSRL